MIKYCIYKWDLHKDELRKELGRIKGLNKCYYKDLVRIVIDIIFNGKDDIAPGLIWDKDSITEIDNGSYQGTLIYLIPLNEYQPSAIDYLMTYIEYGSCSVCDPLQAIQEYSVDGLLNEAQIDDFMGLCKDIVCNTIRPYNFGWRSLPLFDRTEE